MCNDYIIFSNDYIIIMIISQLHHIYISDYIICNNDYNMFQVNYPLCTIAHTPRLPEHCVEYAKVLLWPKENPFGGKLFTLNK